MGLLEVLCWLNSTNRTSTPIVIETNCMQVAKAILAKPVNKTEFGSIIELCLRILAEFDNCKVSFVRRQANRVAHELAQPTHDVIKKYKLAKSNLDELKKLGACILHGVDATKLKFDSHLKMRRFDRIIFNFPHAGFVKKEDNWLMIKMHKDLVYGFFKNARHMLVANGEIHVNHKMKPPYTNWNLEKLAEKSFLILIECAKFEKKDYPGYNNKRGDGNRCDKPFYLGECSTFKFTSLDAK
ncbi:heavy metal-associated isoprenylated plant protein 41-like [Trifolium pratense]|uniref:heavy metal-associated isoprenylated plant protein 41-like n=1 Tax=Trifolium pratense TaxID=57577 RepID=UPI001E694E88|nr:heavy metal-associated isoprenylated plant protein 41-like [Trifolium pratense]